MKLHNIAPQIGAKSAPKRVGRGLGSGHGKQSCRGGKGQTARSGGSIRPGFEGGQMPLVRRVPKRGFTNIFKKDYSIVNVGSLDIFDENTVITAELLLSSGVLSKIEPFGVKILGGGSLTKKLTVQANKFTQSAIEAIEKAGGKAEVV
jgi:large subunit ribosomal protein L15